MGGVDLVEIAARNHSSLAIDEVDIAVHDRQVFDLRIRKRPRQSCKMVIVPDVVLVKESDVFASCMLDREVPR